MAFEGVNDTQQITPPTVMGVVSKKLLPATLAITCLVILFWALLRANAAWHYFAAQTIAEPLFESGSGAAAVFEASEAHINIALQRFPNNPDYLDFEGRLLILKSSQPGVMGAERRALLEAAAENFRQALTVRPLWPYSWVNLLATKDKLGQVDMEFNVALEKAAILGPWELVVQLQVVDSGLRYWGKLGRTERELVQQRVLDALKVQPRKVFEIVKAYGRPDLICGVEDTHRQIKKWCEAVT